MRFLSSTLILVAIIMFVAQNISDIINIKDSEK